MARINEEELSYQVLLSKLLSAAPKDDRTGTGTSEIFGHQMRFDLSKGFPLMTSKRIHFKSIVVELLWFLRGRTDNQWLNDRGVTIWDEWATEEQCAKFGRKAGDLGPIYGHQWRNFGEISEIRGVSFGEHKHIDRPGFDQIAWVINEIKTNPNSRRLIVSGWNPAEANQVALPPCHTLFQFHVNNGKLSCQLYQRSADTFLGVPFNIASYALLTHIVAQYCDLEVGEFIWTGGCVHLYKNHFDQARLQIGRTPREFPKLIIKDNKPIDQYEFEDFELVGYNPWPSIKAEVAV